MRDVSVAIEGACIDWMTDTDQPGFYRPSFSLCVAVAAGYGGAQSMMVLSTWSFPSLSLALASPTLILICLVQRIARTNDNDALSEQHCSSWLTHCMIF